MRIHILQHAEFEGPGYIAKWAELNNHEVSTTHIYLKEKLPNLNDLDFLVIMGGPMSVNDGDKYEWINYELNFIRDAINSGKSVLGICLGAQFIAKSLNAKIYTGNQTEIGWYPILFDKKALPVDLKKHIPDYITSLHWHGETFDLPIGASGFASTPATPNQAFIFRKNVIGLQFHLETTAYTIEGFIENMGDGIQESRYIQPIEMIRQGSENIKKNNEIMGDILSYLSSRIN